MLKLYHSSTNLMNTHLANIPQARTHSIDYVTTSIFTWGTWPIGTQGKGSLANVCCTTHRSNGSGMKVNIGDKNGDLHNHKKLDVALFMPLQPKGIPDW